MSGNISLRESVFEYVKKKYDSEPEYLWKRFPDYAVFRHADNRKWYGAVMDVPKYKLGLSGEERIDILNVKVDDLMFRDTLLSKEGYLPGYHISKGYWLSILLDGTVSLDEVRGMVDMSYQVTASKKKKEKLRAPKEWIIPANPKYYDIEHGFDSTDVIDWKQGSSIKAGDTVFIYVGAPVSAILYKCKVVEADIPYNYQDENLSIRQVMKIQLLKRYGKEQFTFEVLKEKYGIYAVRGPRGIPNSLSYALNSKEVTVHTGLCIHCKVRKNV